MPLRFKSTLLKSPIDPEQITYFRPGARNELRFWTPLLRDAPSVSAEKAINQAIQARGAVPISLRDFSGLNQLPERVFLETETPRELRRHYASEGVRPELEGWGVYLHSLSPGQTLEGIAHDPHLQEFLEHPTTEQVLIAVLFGQWARQPPVGPLGRLYLALDKDGEVIYETDGPLQAFYTYMQPPPGQSEVARDEWLTRWIYLMLWATPYLPTPLVNR